LAALGQLAKDIGVLCNQTKMKTPSEAVFPEERIRFVSKGFGTPHPKASFSSTIHVVAYAHKSPHFTQKGTRVSPPLKKGAGGISTRPFDFLRSRKG
jgi:hypothetical protein